MLKALKTKLRQIYNKNRQEMTNEQEHRKCQ